MTEEWCAEGNIEPGGSRVTRACAREEGAKALGYSPSVVTALMSVGSVGLRLERLHLREVACAR